MKNLNQMNKIGILFIGIGIYNKFWNDFYDTVNRNFCISSVKFFYVFTDDVTLYENKLHENVSIHPVKDRGWILNVMRKSDFFLEIEEILKCNDFIFHLNGNYKVLSPIFDSEILPVEKNEWLSVLSFDFYTNISPDNYTYDRNPCSQAYIPFGGGKYYFQSGFYGGRTQYFLEMTHWVKKKTDIDLLHKIIPLFHDESYVNKYLLHRNPKMAL